MRPTSLTEAYIGDRHASSPIDYAETMEAATAPQPISSLSLSDLRETFALTRDRADPFFEQWLTAAEPLNDFEQQALARLKRNYENISETNPLEEVVKLVVVAPLLDLAGFYQPPFSIRAEVSTKLIATDAGQTFTGSIDVLVVKQRLWVLIIESKQSRFDVTAGIPQALSYMLSQSAVQAPESGNRFGMVTNGREAVFLKLALQPSPVYVQSRIYQVIDADAALTEILQGLKAIGQRSL
ncbi:MAG: type I restriction endonuclease subunit R [Verrucomicrobia bacterium]|nr:type I restriction endonuclease subunit R [Leptolyngbya sp. ES-bin-22]